MKALHSLLAFNRGMISKLALARVDLKRTALSGEIQTNWMPRVLGSMMLRPGTNYIGSTLDNSAAKFLPFLFSTSDKALVELTDGAMRVLIGDTVLARPTLSNPPTVLNGAFTSNLSSWTDSDESGAVSAWATGGYMSLLGTGINAAIRDQSITIDSNDYNDEHAFTIVIERGSVTLRLGSSQGDNDVLTDTVLREGYHSIAFDHNSTTVWIRFSNTTNYAAYVDSIAIESAGDVEIVTPWPEASLNDIRRIQSGDVIFVACKDYQQMRIERQAARSWSCVNYQATDGPFRDINVSPIRITPSALTGDITLTATRDLFTSGNVGGLFELSSNGQAVEIDVTGEDQWSNEIRVTGVGASQRQFSFERAGTFTASVTLQRSVGEPGDWVDVVSYTSNGTTNYNDELDNQIIYYRVGVDTGDFTSGTVELSMTYTAGSITGVCRVTNYTSKTVVNASVLIDLGGIASTDDWSESEWSDRRGWPTSVALHDGRLWWAGKDRIWGSVSDGFASFDSFTEGDSGPIQRSIGSGPVDKINWMVSTTHLLVGAEGSELVARSSSLDEPLTPTSFGLKPIEELGSANLEAVKVGASVLFVQRNGSRVYELSFDNISYNYVANDLTAIVPEIGDSSFTRIAVQRQPDTRIHIVRGDGKVAVMIYDKVENVTCWVLVETDGIVEDVVVMPGVIEDEVYYVVKRTINSVTKRYLEKWALESEGQGNETTKLVDSCYTYSGSSTDTITGLSHLEGELVSVWGNTKDLGTHTVSSGSITLGEEVTLCYVGLPYVAQFKSAKLATAVATQTNPTPLTQRKRIDHLALVLADTHYQGLKYGSDFDHLDNLPLVEKDEVIAGDTIHEAYDSDAFELNGDWSTDTRLCLQASSPRPCTVLAAVIGISSNDKM